MQRDRKYSKYIHVLLYLKDKGNIWVPIRLKKEKEIEKIKQRITIEVKANNDSKLHSRKKNMQRYFILEKRQLILKKIIQFFTIKPSHKNLNHPKHLSPSFSLSLPYTNPLGGPSRIFLPSTEERRELSLSLSLASNRAPREGESDPRKISLAFTWIPFTWIVSRLLMQRQVDDDVRQSVRSTIRLFRVAVTPSSSV